MLVKQITQTHTHLHTTVVKYRIVSVVFYLDKRQPSRSDIHWERCDSFCPGSLSVSLLGYWQESRLRSIISICLPTHAVINNKQDIPLVWKEWLMHLNAVPGISPLRHCVCHTWDWSPCLAPSHGHPDWRTPPWCGLSTGGRAAVVWWGYSGLHSAPCSVAPVTHQIYTMHS